MLNKVINYKLYISKYIYLCLNKKGLGEEKEILSRCDVSLVVRIVAFQAVDPGSNPGRRNFLILSLIY